MQFPVRTGYFFRGPIERAWLGALLPLVAACSGNQGTAPALEGGSPGPSGSGQGASPDGGSIRILPEAGAGMPSGDASAASDAGVREPESGADQSADAKVGPGDAGSSVAPDTDAAPPVDAAQPPGIHPEGSSGQPTCTGLFCEDFESGKIDPAVWDTKTFGGQTVTVQATTVAHGTYAVQFHATPNLVSYDFIITKSAPAALSGHFFGRAYFYITPNPPAEHMEFFFAGTSGFPNLKYIEVAAAGTAWQLTFVDLMVAGGQATSSPGTQEKYAGGGTVPVQKWACLEWEVNDTPDQETVYVDGTEDVAFPSINLNGVSTGLVGGFADFGFGYYAWHPAAAPIDVYYDDIVLDTKRVGCLP